MFYIKDTDIGYWFRNCPSTIDLILFRVSEGVVMLIIDLL